MDKAFEKILERLEEERELSYADFSRYVEEVSPCLDAEYDDFFHRGLERASRLVKEVAEEYNGGWIPCSDRLPEENKDGWTHLILSIKTGEVIFGFWHNEEMGFCKHFRDGVCRVCGVIAWMPLPEPFKERD